jgi:hypothetical protein
MHAIILQAFLMVAPTPVAPRPAAAPIVTQLTALRTLADQAEHLLRSGGHDLLRTNLPDEISAAIRSR